MLCYLDKAFCCSPGCVGKCGRQLTDEHRKAAEAANLDICMCYFCDRPERHENDEDAEQPT